MDCEVGHFCQVEDDRELSCQALVKVGQPCRANVKCEFGSLCANHTCTRIGSLPTGTLYNLTDSELYSDPSDDERGMYWVCENFYAVLTNIMPEGTTRRLFECTNGPERAFEEYGRTDGNLDCIFNMTRTSEGGQTVNFTETAKCGFNKDDRFYCPARRGATEFADRNRIDRETWRNAPTTCHIRSTIHNCVDIKNDPARSVAFRDFLRTEWITTGDNWSLVANNDRCVGNSIASTASYWRLIDSASSLFLSSFGLVAGLIVLVFN
jgi:hypothetical protein